MKKILSMVMAAVFMVCMMTGCKAKTQTPQPTVPQQPAVLLPGSMTVGESSTQLTWADNSCTYTLDGKTYRFIYNGTDTLTVYTDTEAEKDTEAMKCVFDKNGYLTKVSVPDKDIIGNVRYEDDYSAFGFQYTHAMSFEGTAVDQGVVFDRADGMTVNISYDRSFITEITGSMQIKYGLRPESDDIGTLKKLTFTRPDGEATEITVTPSQTGLTHAWQRIPAIYFVFTANGMSSMMIVMSMVAAGYIGK